MVLGKGYPPLDSLGNLTNHRQALEDGLFQVGGPVCLVSDCCQDASGGCAPPKRLAAYEVACCAMVENAQTSDAQEGMRAFLEKRSPKWGT